MGNVKYELSSSRMIIIFNEEFGNSEFRAVSLQFPRCSSRHRWLKCCINLSLPINARGGATSEARGPLFCRQTESTLCLLARTTESAIEIIKSKKALLLPLILKQLRQPPLWPFRSRREMSQIEIGRIAGVVFNEGMGVGGISSLEQFFRAAERENTPSSALPR